MKAISVFILLIPLLFIAACQNPETKASMQTEKFKEGFVESDQVKLQYLDWGGTGQVLILLCGLGDTPFLFQELAKELSLSFRVIGYSRRNHGKSIAKEEKYDNATLVSDLKLLMDSLKIERAHFLGWSMGGNEITELAALYPERTGKLIYFESGYDLSDPGFAELVTHTPKSFLPDSSVMNSLDNYREWYHRFWFGDVEWNNSLEDNLNASAHVSSNGRVVTIPGNDVFKSILTEAMNYQRIYKRVHAPCLVIYAEPFFFPFDNSPATLELYDSIETKIVSPWRATNKRRIEQETRNVTIVEAPKGSHTSFLFLSHDFLVKSIKSFLNAEQ